MLLIHLLALAPLGQEEAIHTLSNISLKFWNKVRYQEKVKTLEDKAICWESIKTFPVYRNFSSKNDPDCATSDSIILKSFVKQDNEPEHLLLQLKGEFAITLREPQIKGTNQEGITIFHIHGQSHITQIVRELPPHLSSLASKGAFLIFVKGKPILWLGQAFLEIFGQYLDLGNSESFFSSSLFSTLIWYSSQGSNITLPAQNPNVDVIIEGRENEEFRSLFSDSGFIKNEIGYRKTALDPRDPLFYSLSTGFDFAFSSEYRARALLYLDNSISFMDTYQEMLIFYGKDLSKNERLHKYKQGLKAFFGDEKQKQRLPNIAISFMSVKTAPYFALKHLTM